eukprot:10467-Chlamydomonas_euryale.AAC.1
MAAAVAAARLRARLVVIRTKEAQQLLEHRALHHADVARSPAATVQRAALLRLPELAQVREPRRLAWLPCQPKRVARVGL